MKPIALVVDLLTNSTKRGDVVLDPFSGSGTTILACEELGRRGRGIEIEGRYCDVIVRRWQERTGLAARLSSSGMTFSEVSKQRGER